MTATTLPAGWAESGDCALSQSGKSRSQGFYPDGPALGQSADIVCVGSTPRESCLPMIRTTLSFCALFGSLLLVSKWLQESNRPSPPLAPAVESEAVRTTDSPADEGVAPARRPISASAALTPQSCGESPFDQAARQSLGTAYFVSYEEDFSATQAVEQALLDIDPFSLTDEVESEAEAAPADKKATESISDEPDTSEPQTAEDVVTDAATDKDATTQSEPATSDAPASPTDEQSADKASANKSADDTEVPLELSPELLDLQHRLRNALAWYYFRPENTATRSPWGSMHWMLAYGVDSQLIVGSERVNAIGYLNYNGVCNGQRLFYVQGGKLQAQIGVGVQGHAGQYLAMLAQSRVKPDYPILVNGYKFTVADLIEHEKDTCRPASELTFKLIALSHYLKSDEKWVSNDGQQWDIPRLIKEELAQPINGAACGGTHRMTGFSYAVRKREQRDEPIEGQWKRAHKFVHDFHEYTFRLQNPDGSFSTDWFVQRADYGDTARRLQTTGHIAEWLAFSLDKQELTDPRMVKAMSYLTDLLLENRGEKWSIGPLGHGLHALAIYDERVFGGQPGQREQQLAEIRRQQLRR
jgi:hypothetical protein